EDRTPSEPAEKRATQHRPEGQSDSVDGAPRAYGLGTLSGVGKEVNDHRQTARHENSGADTLPSTSDDQQREITGDSAQEGTEREDRQAQQESAPTTEPIDNRTSCE